MKSGLSVAALASVSLLLAACGGGGAIPEQAETTGGGGGGDAEVVIRYGNIYPEETTFGVAIQSMSEAISEASDGAIQVDTFHGGTLGSEQEHVEAIREASLEMMQTGTAGIALYVPETALFEQWYAYDDLDTLVEAFQEITPELDEIYQGQGFKLLGAFYNGPRSIISREPVRSFDDVQGLRLRVPGSDLYVEMANALGAQAVSLPLGDVYTGLQTGTIDAMEGAPDDVAKGAYGEVAKYYTLDRHVYHPLSIVYNLDAWNALDAEQQEIIQTAVDDASQEQIGLLEEANETALADLEGQGVEIIEIEDRQRWAEAVQSAGEKFAQQFGENGQLIVDAMENAWG
jgi:TRAP-type transport system periplasmic protein